MARRKGFSRLLDKMEQGGLLVVTKLDRLGRDAIDVSMTVGKLGKMGIRVHCLALSGTDLTSSAGRMTMNVINSVAQFKRDLLIECTQPDMARSRAQGKRTGRPAALTPDQRQAARNRIRNGETISAIAREMETSRQTIMHVRDQGLSCGTSCTIVRIDPHFRGWPRRRCFGSAPPTGSVKSEFNRQPCPAGFPRAAGRT